MAPMSEADGWKPLSEPERRSGADSFRVSAFARLARAHALSVAGDAMVVLALADSLFFSMPADDARWRVFLYLALTMAPFAVVAPLIGPALDRAAGGRRWMIIGANGLRALICFMMIGDLHSLLLFPEAFAVLVLGKGYGVARSALVPTVVRTDAELVRANSKLQLISGLAGAAAAIPAGLAILIAGSEGALATATVTFIVATVVALQIPPTRVSTEPEDDLERAELRGVGIFLAASAMGLVRGIVGFLTFLLAFDLRGGGSPPWHFGLVLALTVAGGLAGAALAPVLRRSTSEERMLMMVLALTIATGVATAWIGGLVAAALIGAGVAIVSTSAKLAFDSLVQRDAPDANRGRSFARFETRFQIIWVIGAAIPVVVPIPARAGYLIVAGVAGFALFSYAAGQQAAARGRATRTPAGPGVPPAADLAGPPSAVIEPPGRPDPGRPGTPPPDPTRVDEGGGQADPTRTRPEPGTDRTGPAGPTPPEPTEEQPPPGERRPPVDPTKLQ
jgi:hypothetical protein